EARGFYPQLQIITSKKSCIGRIVQSPRSEVLRSPMSNVQSPMSATQTGLNFGRGALNRWYKCDLLHIECLCSSDPDNLSKAKARSAKQTLDIGLWTLDFVGLWTL